MLDESNDGLKSRLEFLERANQQLAAETEQRRKRWRHVSIAFAVGAFVVGGVALAANGNCPNGMPVCFVANQPALASDVNLNFAQLKEWLELKVGPVGSSNVSLSGPTTVTGSIVANAAATQLSKVQVNGNFSNFGAGASDRAEIANDTGIYKELMILGNRAADGVNRVVGIWDRLVVHGDLTTTRLLPNYDSGWVAVNSNSANEATFNHGLAAVPSQVMLQQCGALSASTCTTRVVMAGTRGYQDGSAYVNPVSVTADSTSVVVAITTAFVWGYWRPTTGWGCPGDADGNCSTGFYRVLAWR